MTREICVCAALRLKDGRVYRGHRHDAAIIEAERFGATFQDIADAVQGFMTTRNRFVNRKEAMALERAAGLGSADTSDGTLRGEDLSSEDLYQERIDTVLNKSEEVCTNTCLKCLLSWFGTANMDWSTCPGCAAMAAAAQLQKLQYPPPPADQSTAWSTLWSRFHLIWGQAVDGRYVKDDWMALQAVVEHLERHFSATAVANELAMGHARIDECATQDAKGKPLYDRISAVIQRLSNARSEQDNRASAAEARLAGCEARAREEYHLRLAAEYKLEQLKSTGSGGIRPVDLG